jgi:hypothetical protein
MIALISSCIDPFGGQSSSRSFIPVATRLQQTRLTIDQLGKQPFSGVWLLDNSVAFDPEWTRGTPVRARHFPQYQFSNKGINELLMLLSVLTELPEETPIFKISGRYRLTADFVPVMAGGIDFKVKGYDYAAKCGTISTRGYWVANKKIYETFLVQTLREVFVYPHRTVGLRSAWINLREIVRPVTSPRQETAIEFAAARVLKINSYRVELSRVMGIEGTVAGFEGEEMIRE